jgi:hypothetical protein
MAANPNKVLRQAPAPRNILTTYYEDVKATKMVGTAKGVWPANACANALKNMRRNKYGAMLAEVYDTATGKLYAVLRFKIVSNGKHKIETLFDDEYKETYDAPPRNH